jgi:hypothetical protein
MKELSTLLLIRPAKGRFEISPVVMILCDRCHVLTIMRARLAWNNVFLRKYLFANKIII